MAFKFGLNQQVMLTTSGEAGAVVGRAEYESGESTYLVSYKAADGRAVEVWWRESALESVAEA